MSQRIEFQTGRTMSTGIGLRALRTVQITCVGQCQRESSRSSSLREQLRMRHNTLLRHLTQVCLYRLLPDNILEKHLLTYLEFTRIERKNTALSQTTMLSLQNNMQIKQTCAIFK